MATNEIELSTETQEILDRHNLRTIRQIEKTEITRDRDGLKTDIWRWKDIQTAIKRIVDDMPPECNRPVIVPVNSSYEASLSHTIYVGVRTILPSETNPAHRHGGNAMRFTIDGDVEMKTNVGGEEFPMQANDLITIPQWRWHGHINEADNEVTWLEIHDTPLLIDALNKENPFEDNNGEQQTIDKPVGYYNSLYGETRTTTENGGIPGPFDGYRKPTPPYRFDWTDMSRALNYAEKNQDTHSPYDGVTLEYTNPARGAGPLFPTFGVNVQRLLNGEATRAHSHNAIEVNYVIEGKGQSVVGDSEMDWSGRDIFIIPPNQTHQHNPDADATLLNLSNRPLLEAINFYQEVDKS